MSFSQLTRRQQLFVAEYVANKGNGKRAAIAAGYSQNAATQQASLLLTYPKVREAIEKRWAKAFDRYDVTPEKITRELAKMAFGNVEDFISIQDDGSIIIDFSTATSDQLASLSSIQVDEYVEGRGEDGRLVKSIKFKQWDKRAALMDLAKLATMLPADRLQISGPGGGPIEVKSSPIDLDKLDTEQRAMLKQLLLTAKRGPVTDVEEVEELTEEEDDAADDE